MKICPVNHASLAILSLYVIELLRNGFLKFKIVSIAMCPLVMSPFSHDFLKVIPRYFNTENWLLFIVLIIVKMSVWLVFRRMVYIEQLVLLIAISPKLHYLIHTVII